jgi:hypothetical protein
MVHMTTHVLHAAQSPRSPNAPDTVRNYFDEKRADEFDYECRDRFHIQHRLMVALSGHPVKAGKPG